MTLNTLYGLSFPYHVWGLEKEMYQGLTTGTFLNKNTYAAYAGAGVLAAIFYLHQNWQAPALYDYLEDYPTNPYAYAYLAIKEPQLVLDHLAESQRYGSYEARLIFFRIDLAAPLWQDMTSKK